MFVFSFKASTAKLIAMLCICVAALAAVIMVLPEAGSSLNVNKSELSGRLSEINVKSEKGRLSFLSTLGYSVDETAVEKTSERLPEVFDAVTEKYNELQRMQGFDLTRFRGKKLESYTYRVLSLPGKTDVSETNCLATLIVHKGKVVASDICYPDEGGVAPLVVLV